MMRIGFIRNEEPEHKGQNYSGWCEFSYPSGGRCFWGRVHSHNKESVIVLPHLVAEPFLYKGERIPKYRKEEENPLELPKHALIRQPITSGYIDKLLSLNSSNEFEKGDGI